MWNPFRRTRRSPPQRGLNSGYNCDPLGIRLELIAEHLGRLRKAQLSQDNTEREHTFGLLFPTVDVPSYRPRAVAIIMRRGLVPVYYAFDRSIEEMLEIGKGELPDLSILALESDPFVVQRGNLGDFDSVWFLGETGRHKQAEYDPDMFPLPMIIPAVM